QSYVDGFVDEVHNAYSGYLVGVYATPAAISSDISSQNVAQADAIWIASPPTKKNPYPQITVWNQGLSDSLLPNGQRAHQFLMNQSTTFGSSKINIDPDIDNAPVLNANNGSKLPSSYTYTSFDYPNATGTYAWGINDRSSSAIINGSGQTGQVVGEYQDTAGNTHGFLLSSGTYTSIDYPGAVSTVAYGINNLGQIAGAWLDSSSKEHGFLLSGVKYVPLNYPGGSGTIAYGINDAGQVVGSYASGNTLSGFLYYQSPPPAANFFAVNYPGATETVVRGINGDGVAAGTYYQNSGYSLGFVEYASPPTWNGTFSSVGYSGALNTLLTSFNNNNQATGFYDTSGVTQGFMLSYGIAFTSFNYAGSTETGATSTNDFEQTVGYYFDNVNNIFHGFLAVPQQ